MSGTRVAETILASVHMRARPTGRTYGRKRSDQITAKQPCEEGAVHIWGPDADRRAKLLMLRAAKGWRRLRRSAVTFHPDRPCLSFGTVSLANNLFGPFPCVLGTYLRPGCGRKHRKETHMDKALSFLISTGIAAFVRIIAYTIASGSPLVWTLLGILPVVVGLISLYQAIRGS